MKKKWLSGIMAGIFLTGVLGGCADQGQDFTGTLPDESSTEISLDAPSEVPSAVPVEVSEEKTEEESTLNPDFSPVSGDIKAEGWSELKKSVNLVNWDLYAAQNDKDNLFYSPFSIVSAMALSDLAAKGETKAQLESGLHIDDKDAFCQDMKEYMAGNDASETTYFRIANAVWLNKDLELSDSAEADFIKPAEEYFGGSFEKADFAGDLEGAKADISKWVSDKTDGFIPNYEPGATADTLADLMNAIYFYGEWEKKFEADDTSDGTFHGTDGDTTQEMMNLFEGSMAYVENKDGITALAMPYADSNLEMDILMTADEGKKLSEVFDASKAEAVFDELDAAERKKLGHLQLPKFTMEKSLNNLPEIFKAMGMEVPFTDNADFSGLAEDMKISGIQHEAKIEVDEEGSRAAAVTEVMLGLTSALDEPEDKIDFIVDRPFIYVIRDREQGIILFTGRMNNLSGK
ncbi:serpin B [Lachnospiraceae bacterium]|nr:serpin B [Lachnospiraceae bacterium]